MEGPVYKIQKLKSEMQESEPLDRLSELPDLLLLEILSLLPMRDVVATTLISKRWKDLWTTVPCLDFEHFSNYRNLEHFENFVCGAVALWKGHKILKFSLSCDKFYCYLSRDIVDSWLLFVVEKQVEELSLKLPLSLFDSGYCPPQRLYSCSSITKLSLAYSEMKIEENVQWNQLRSLTIASAEYLSEEVLNQVLSGAPLLEELYLRIYNISETFNIRSRTLKILHMNRPSWSSNLHAAVLRIWAPNLSTLNISGFFYGTCLLDVPSLIDAYLRVNNYRDPDALNSGGFGRCEMFDQICGSYEVFDQVCRSIRHVEKLTLSDWCIKKMLLIMKKKKDMVVLFSNAKFLKVLAAAAPKMLDVLEMFPKLEMLMVEQLQDHRPLCYV